MSTSQSPLTSLFDVLKGAMFTGPLQWGATGPRVNSEPVVSGDSHAPRAVR